MDEEEKATLRGFVVDLVEELFSTGNFAHPDGYAGALLVIDLEESVEKLREKGWKLTKEEVGG